jgi:phage shock protein PspC (stress-responsive transcriptional regulator)
MKKFKKINGDKVGEGVLSGFAYYMGLPTWLVRVIYFFFTFFTSLFPGIILYFLLTFILDYWEEDPKDYEEVCG